MLRIPPLTIAGKLVPKSISEGSLNKNPILIMPNRRKEYKLTVTWLNLVISQPNTKFPTSMKI
jgi:hypothetical protein